MDESVTKTYDKVSLAKVLRQLKKEYDLNLAFDSEIMQAFEVDTVYNGETVRQVLESLVAGKELVLEDIGNTIVIYPLEDRVKPEKPERFDIKVFGRVVDAGTGEPLPYAHVELEGMNKHTNTNQDGYFYLSSVDNDTLVLVSTYIGYINKTFQLTPSTDLSNIVIKQFESRAVLPLVSVFGAENQLLEIVDDISVQKMNANKLAGLPGKGMGDLFSSIQTLPGVNGSTENNAGISIRGGLSDENLVLFDGFTIYHQDHFFGVYSAFNLLSIKGVRLHKGVFDSRFGGRNSSVLELTGKNGSTQNVKGSAYIDLMTAAASVEVPIFKNKGSLIVTGRRAFSDVVQTGLFKKLFRNVYDSNNNGVERENTQLFEEAKELNYSFYDATAKLSVRTSKKDFLSISLYTGKDQMQLSLIDTTFQRDQSLIYNSFEDDLSWGNVGVSAKWYRQWRDDIYSTSTLGLSQLRNNIVVSDRNNVRVLTPDIEFADSFIVDEGSRVDNFSDVNYRGEVVKDFKKHRLVSGLEWVFNESFVERADSVRVNNFTNQTTLSETRSITKSNRYTLYLQDEIDKNRLSLKFGGRLSYYQLLDQYQLAPRLMGSYTLSDSWKLKFGAGRNFQYVRRVAEQDIYQNTSDEWRLVNGEDIPLGRTDQFAIGLLLQKKNSVFDVEIYHKRLKGSPELGPVWNSSSRDFLKARPILEYTEGKGIGLDLIYQYNTPTYSGWISYSFNRTEKQADTVNNGESFVSNATPLHEFKSVQMLKIKRLELSAVFVYGAKRRYTPIDDITNDNLEPNQKLDVVLGGFNSNFLPAYHRLDVNAQYSGEFKSLNFKVGISLYNVYDDLRRRAKRNINSVSTIIPFESENNFQIVEKRLSGLGFTPSIFLIVEI